MKKAYELIEKPENWCTGALYKNKYGTVSSEDEAYSYCAAGAINTSYCRDHKVNATMRKLQSHLKDVNLIRWNDNSDHETVYKTLKMLDI